MRENPYQPPKEVNEQSKEGTSIDWVTWLFVIAWVLFFLVAWLDGRTSR
jgi:hypothetical protein